METFRKIQSFSFADVDHFSTGSLITRITNDVSQVQNFVQTFMRGMFRSPVMIIGAVVMSFTLEAKIAWLIFAIMPVLAVFIGIIMVISAPRYTRMQQQIDSLNTSVNETVTNDVDAVGEMLNTTFIQLISGIINIIGTVILMLATNWLLGLITIIVTPLLTMISKNIVKKGRNAYAGQQKNLGSLNGFAEEIISGQKVVKYLIMRRLQ